MLRRAATCALIITIGAIGTIGTGGCGGGSSGDTGLKDALGQVKSTDSTRTYLNYGSLSTLKEKTGFDDKLLTAPRFSRVYRFATGTLGTAGVGKLEQDLGVDLSTSTSAILAGDPPNQVGLFHGTWNSEAIGTKFSNLDRKRQDEAGGTMWVFSEQPTTSPGKDPLSKTYFNNFNMAYVSGDKFAYSPSRQGISQAVGVEGETLADSEPHMNMANCLGDVAAAMLITPRNPQLIGMAAVGVRVESKDKTTEVTCLAASPGGDPKKMADAIEVQVREGEFKEFLKLPKVTFHEDTKIIELIGPSSAQVGRVFDMVTTGSLDRLIDAAQKHGHGHN